MAFDGMRIFRAVLSVLREFACAGQRGGRLQPLRVHVRTRAAAGESAEDPQLVAVC